MRQYMYRCGIVHCHDEDTAHCGLTRWGGRRNFQHVLVYTPSDCLWRHPARPVQSVQPKHLEDCLPHQAISMQQ